VMDMTDENRLTEALERQGEYEDRIAALEKERDELLASCDDHTAHVNEYEEAIEERDRLGKHLNKYGQHLEGCSWDPSRWNDGPTPCDCGLHRALAGGEGE